MEYLWTPWRHDYVTRAQESSRPGVPAALSAWLDAQPKHEPAAYGDCVFCNMIAAVDAAIASGMGTEEAEKLGGILLRGPSCFLCLNAFPYSTGHVLIVPYTHIDSLAALSAQAAQEMMAHCRRIEMALRTVYKPSGMNFGLNLGEAAGAGIATHIHMHVLPRWNGDTNFMTVIANTRVLPETLDVTWSRLHAAIQEAPIDSLVAKTPVL